MSCFLSFFFFQVIHKENSWTVAKQQLSSGPNSSLCIWLKNWSLTHYHSLPWKRRCLSLFALLKQHTRNWVASKQQKLIPPSSGGWKIQTQDAGRFGVWWRTTSWSDHFGAVSSQGGRGRELSGFFYRGTNPIHEGSTLMTQFQILGGCKQHSVRSTKLIIFIHLVTLLAY